MLTNSSPYGRGVVSTIDARDGDVLFTEKTLLFGQDFRSYKIQPRCGFCTQPRPCGCSDNDDPELERYLQTEIADADPRGRIALSIIKSNSVQISQFLHRGYRLYTEFPDHSSNLITDLMNFCGDRNTELDQILGMLRSVCLSVSAASTYTSAPSKMSEPELKRLWLSIGEVPTFEELEERELPPIIGVALCALGSNVNHRCLDPNAEFRWEVTADDNTLRLEVVALKAIKRGEEIFVCYYDDDDVHLAAAAARRALLSDHFGFVCMCDHCREE